MKADPDKIVGWGKCLAAFKLGVSSPWTRYFIVSSALPLLVLICPSGGARCAEPALDLAILKA
jgi:hypothetical protein